MLKLYLSLAFVSLTILLVLAARKNDSMTTTPTSNPLSSILNKFYQNDYKYSYEWAEVVRSDERFGKFTKHTFKYNRTVAATNGTFSFYIDAGYDVEIIIQAYRFASNEFRLFPMRFQFNFCEAIATGAMGLDEFAKNGNMSCPLLKGRTYYFCNWKPDEARFPPIIPTGSYMVETQFLYHSIEFLLVRGYGRIYRPIAHD